MPDRAAQSIRRRLTGASRLVRLTAGARRALVLLAIAMVIALLAAVADAAFDLPGAARLIIGGLIIAGAALSAASLIAAIAEPRRPEQAAGFIERRRGMQRNELIVAAQLESAAAAKTLTGHLARRAVDRGRAALEYVRPRDTVDFSALRAPALAFAAAAATLLITAAVAPRFVAMEARRFVDPRGNHAPYSPTVFEIDWSPDDPIVGDDVRVRINLRGAAPTNVRLALLDEQGAVAERITPITSNADEDSYERTFTALREPLRFHIEASTGRSRVYEITPLARPRIRSSVIEIEPPDYTRRPSRRESVGLIESGATPPVALRTVAGAELTWTIETTLPLARAEASGFDRTDIEARSLTLRATLSDPGERRLSVRPIASSGLGPDGSLRARILVAADAPPTIDLAAPGRPDERLAANLGDIIPVRGVARDDIALEHLDLHIALERPDFQMPAKTIETLDLLPSGATRAPLAPINTQIDTAMLGARAGDILHLTLRARDGRPDLFGGPQNTSHGPIRIELLEAPRSTKCRGAGNAVQPAQTSTSSAESGAGEPGRPDSSTRTGGRGGNPSDTRDSQQSRDGALDSAASPGESRSDRRMVGRAPGRAAADAPVAQRREASPDRAGPTDSRADRSAEGEGQGDPSGARGAGPDEAAADTNARRDADSTRPTRAGVMTSRAARAIERVRSVEGLSLRDIPGPYRDIVSDYLLRIAEAEASSGPAAPTDEQ